MTQQRFALALSAVVLSFALTDIVDAYPSTARSGSTTVTGAYRPLDLQLTLIERYETDNFLYESALDVNENNVSFLGVFKGQFTTSGDSNPGGSPVSGDAGYWVYSFYVTDGFGGLSVDISGSSPQTVTINTDGLGTFFGSLVFLEGGSYGVLSVPYEDTPQTLDLFRLYSTALGPLVEIIASDLNGTDFTLRLLQPLVHVGPFPLFGEFPLDTDRNKLYCEASTLPDGGTTVINPNCGRMTELTASSASVPEPTTLALFGLGLVGLGWRARARR